VVGVVVGFEIEQQRREAVNAQGRSAKMAPSQQWLLFSRSTRRGDQAVSSRW